MIEFAKKIMITGAEMRTKKSDGSNYYIVHTMGENGQTFASIFTGDVNKLMSIKKMQEYNVKFVVNVGQYTNLKVVDIEA